MVEERANKTQETYLETIIQLCDELDIDIEDVKKFISPIIKSRLEVQVSKINLIKNDDLGETLTFDEYI